MGRICVWSESVSGPNLVFGPNCRITVCFSVFISDILILQTVCYIRKQMHSTSLIFLSPNNFAKSWLNVVTIRVYVLLHILAARSFAALSTATKNSARSVSNFWPIFLPQMCRIRPSRAIFFHISSFPVVVEFVRLRIFC